DQPIQPLGQVERGDLLRDGRWVGEIGGEGPRRGQLRGQLPKVCPVAAAQDQVMVVGELGDEGAAGPARGTGDKDRRHGHGPRSGTMWPWTPRTPHGLTSPARPSPT